MLEKVSWRRAKGGENVSKVDGVLKNLLRKKVRRSCNLFNFCVYTAFMRGVGSSRLMGQMCLLTNKVPHEGNGSNRKEIVLEKVSSPEIRVRRAPAVPGHV